VITTEDQYPQDVKFTAVKERTEQIARLGEGDEVLVKFDIRGREYNGNFYVDLNAWRIESGGRPDQRHLLSLFLRHRCPMFLRCQLHPEMTKTTCRFNRARSHGNRHEGDERSCLTQMGE